MSLGVRSSGFLVRYLPGILLVCSGLSGAGPAEYVVETQVPAQFSAIALKYGLTIVKSWPSTDGTAYLVSHPGALTQPEINRLRSERGVKEIESNIEISDSEASAATVSKVNVTELASALAIGGTSPFYSLTANKPRALIQSGAYQTPLETESSQ